MNKSPEILYLKLLCFYEHLYEGSSISLLPRIDKHARCLVNGLTLSSDLNGADRSNVVKAYFAIIDSEPYPSLFWNCAILFQIINYNN